MTLTPGARLSSYEILESIGAGGMGEVYKARDTKLGREVAIKVLPEAFAENKERLARFEREARLLASLNHPNIATLFDLQESEDVHSLSCARARAGRDAGREDRARSRIQPMRSLPLVQANRRRLWKRHTTRASSTGI